MAILDLLLNLAALLLWFGWRTVGIDRRARLPALSLASTLKRAEPRPGYSWAPLAALLVLLLGRTVAYHYLALPTRWIPSLDLGLVTLHIRLDSWPRSFLFSFGSFAHALGLTYLWLLLLLLAGRHQAGQDPLHPLVRAQFGILARLPLTLLLAVVVLTGFLLWLALHPLLLWLELTAQPPATFRAWQQALAFALSLALAWKPLLIALFAIHALNTYLFVGNNPWWNYAAHCGKNLLRWMPLAFGKLDFAPIAGITLVLVGAHFLSRGLLLLFHHAF